MGDVELLLVRIDHFRERATYVSVLRAWLEELQIANGRVICMGADLQLLFVAASRAQIERLLAFYRSRCIDTNSRGELCVDRFIDVLGRKAVAASACRGFLEMDVLSAALLQKVLVHEWQAEQQWLDAALATKRTKAFLQWKEAAKTARKERRKREGQEKQQERQAKRAKKEQEAQQAEEEAEKEAEGGEEEAEKPTLDSEPKEEQQQQEQEQQQQQKPKQQQSAQKPQRSSGQRSPQQKQQQQNPSGAKKSKSKSKKRRNKQAGAGNRVES
ncbi:RWD domain-containing protein 3 [Phytophthora cinnamomi]|uniref:RWD domain-containing protein 3 n=1 Tax=Phytophthora cinnamomi TaxID=4785 RepID=UPI003559F7C3|nr:RWD domain-containing protein 3 [Phytophthora cinnamomi]